MANNKYGADSPANSYLRPKSDMTNLPATTNVNATPAKNDPRMHEFIQFVADNENGNPRAIAEAILLNRGQVLQQRRDLINFARGLIRLPPREIPPEQRIIDLAQQFSRLFKEHAVMLKSRSASLDAAIEVRTKSLDYEHTVAKKEAEIAEEQARKTKALVEVAKAERELRRVEGAEDLDDVREGRREDATDRYREALREIKLREKAAEVTKKEVEADEARKRTNQEGQSRPPHRQSSTEKAAEEARATKEKYTAASILEDAENQIRADLAAKYGEDSDIVKLFDSDREARRMSRMERN